MLRSIFGPKLEILNLISVDFKWTSSKWGKFWLMFQSHPTKGPAPFLTPVQIPARKAKWSTYKNFTLVPLFWWSHQATGFVQLDTAARLHFFQINCRINTAPCNTRTGIVWAPHGTPLCVQYHTKGPCRTPLVWKSALKCSVHYLSTLSGYDICSSWHYHH